MLDYIIMANQTNNKLRLIGKKKCIKDYQSVPKKKLFGIIARIKRITENVLKNRLNKILKMQNLSLHELKKIKRMNNLSLDELKQIAMARHIKNYKDMMREDLLISLVKSNKSNTELRKSEHSNKEIEESKMLFNELRDNFSKEK